MEAQRNHRLASSAVAISNRPPNPNHLSDEFLFHFTASISVTTVSFSCTKAEEEEEGRKGRGRGGRRWSAFVTWYGLATGVVLAVDAPAMPPPPEKAAVISPPCLAIRPPHAPSLCVSLSSVHGFACFSLVVSSHLLLLLRLSLSRRSWLSLASPAQLRLSLMDIARTGTGEEEEVGVVGVCGHRPVGVGWLPPLSRCVVLLACLIGLLRPRSQAGRLRR